MQHLVRAKKSLLTLFDPLKTFTQFKHSQNFVEAGGEEEEGERIFY